MDNKAQRRKSSAVVTEVHAVFLESAELSEADRRLAEMGYVQVYALATGTPGPLSF